MAVYTQVNREDLSKFLTDYDVGELLSFAGIAQGVENSNFRVQTTHGRYILTLYEKRVDASDLPFFVSLMEHASAKGVPVPHCITDRTNIAIKQLCGRPACLITHMPGDTIDVPTPDLAFAAGQALARFHKALADFPETRANSMGPDEWIRLADICTPRIHEFTTGRTVPLRSYLQDIIDNWPQTLPQSAIHADLFPDNVMIANNKVSGIIDVYFACTDSRAYDLAIMHSAWCFDIDGVNFDALTSDQLLAGYTSVIALDANEQSALPLLCQGATMRFFLSRAFDWLNTADDAIVTRKDPMAYWRRLEFYRSRENHKIFEGMSENG